MVSNRTTHVPGSTVNDLDLLAKDTFVRRHIGPDPSEVSEMLRVVGRETLDDLIDATIPSDIRLDRTLDLPGARSEAEVLAELRELANRNEVFRSYIGMGYHDCV